jgi:hypothetical protein
MFASILDTLVQKEGSIKLKHIQEAADLMQKQVYMRIPGHAKV